MPTLQQRLAEQPPNTSGIHEGMALHCEDVFDSFNGILPLLLGKRKGGPFISLTLPKTCLQSRASLLTALSDLIGVYDLQLVSFVSAVQTRVAENDPPRLGAILVTADNADSLFQLPWELEFDAESNLRQHTRSEASGEIVSRDTWRSLFDQQLDRAEKDNAYQQLLENFGDPSQLPKYAP